MAAPDPAVDNLKNHFLVALSGAPLSGDYFAGSLSLLIDHNDDGTFGLMINRPVDISIGALLPDLADCTDCPVFEGGPVEQDHLFFLHSSDRCYPETVRVSDDICLTTSAALIDDLAHDRGPRLRMAVLGYAGWGHHQLEQELARSTWLLTPTRSDIVFTAPVAERRAMAGQLLGVDVNLISPGAGHD